MATTIGLYCVCGERVMVYVPKATLAEIGHATPAEIAEMREVDEQEIQDGEVEDAREMVRTLGIKFVDLRETNTCPRCAKDVMRNLTRVLSNAGAEQRGEELLKQVFGNGDDEKDELPF